MRKKKISIEYVRSLLSYDPESGDLTWLVSRGSIKSGRRAGSPQRSRGKTYTQIRIDKSFYKAHHLVWAIYYGNWPNHDLDHEDRDGENNRIKNLRPCTMSQNQANRKINVNNKSGFKGVSFNKKIGKWRAYFNCNGKRKYLGVFDKPELAGVAYWTAVQAAFGDYARAE